MKRVLMLYAVLALFSSGLQAQSNHTIFIDGNNDFNVSSERFNTTSGSTIYSYLTWDKEYLYFAISGDSPAGPVTDNQRNYHIYIDTDPSITPSNGTGTTSGEVWRFSPTLPFSANYHYVFKTGNNEEVKKKYNGSGWNNDSFTTSNWKNTVSKYWEVRIKLSDLGNPSRINFLAYVEEDWDVGSIAGGFPAGLFSNGTINPIAFNEVYLHIPLMDQIKPNLILNENLFSLNNFIWRIKVKAETASLSDTNTYAGMAKNATDGYDAGIDLNYPPFAPSNYVHVFFPHDNWNSVLGSNFSRDFRRLRDLSTTTESWDFTVSTDLADQMVTLKFSEFADIPAGYDIYLRDVTGGGADHNVRTSGNYSFNSGLGGNRLFKLIIGVTLTPPQIGVNPETLSFGSVKVQEEGTIDLTISNSGQEDLTISSITSNNSVFTFTNLGNTTITSGNSETITVAFSPNTAQVYNGVLTINSNSSVNPTLELPMTGTGLAREVNISATPQNLAFNSVKIGQTKELTLTVSNLASDDPLVISSITSGDQVFSFSGITTPVTIQPDEFAEFSVSFSPLEAVDYSSQLTFVSNATNIQGNFTVALSGTGTELVPNGTVNPSEIAFGNVAVGSYSESSVTISNPGGDIALSIDPVTFSQPGFSLVYNGEYPILVAPDTSVGLTIRFKPVQVTDYSSVVTFVSNNETELTVSLTGSGTKTTVETEFAPGWNLVSVPLNPDDASPAAVFGDDFTTYFLFQYSSVGGYNVPSAVNAGLGYWLGLETGGPLDVFGTANVEQVETALVPGWNIIASPYNNDFLTSEVMFRKGEEVKTGEEAATAGWIQNVYYGYGNGAYAPSTELNKWSGYWFSALMEGVYASFDEENAGIPAEKPGTKQPAETESDINNWAVPIIATTGTVSDNLLVFGASQNATDGFDAVFDYAKPPVSPAPEAVTTYFEQSGWSQYFSKFGSDIRAKYQFPDAGKSWNFRVMSKTSGEVTLTWNDITSLIPEEIRNNYYFRMTGAGIPSIIDMLTVTSVTFNAEAGVVYNFSINSTLTSLEDDLNAPKEFSLGQNFPNPFNPSTSIQYNVKEASQVTLKVYDMIGNEVAILVNEVKPAGSYTVSFDASQLSSGVYLYKMTAGNFVQTRKLVLMK